MQIPPIPVASAAQISAAERRAAQGRATEQGAAEAAARSPFADRLRDVIENTQHDSEVFADGGGLGSQGRDPSAGGERDAGAAEAEDQSPSPGSSTIDLEG